MAAVLVDTGKGLLIGELQMMDCKWAFLGDVLDTTNDPEIEIHNPFLPPWIRFQPGYGHRMRLIVEILRNV